MLLYCADESYIKINLCKWVQIGLYFVARLQAKKFFENCP